MTDGKFSLKVNILIDLFRGLHVHSTPISISEVYKVYKKANMVTYKDQEIRNAFHAYHNLLDKKYVFQCLLCKDAPPVLIFDGNAKLRCSLDFHRDVDKCTEGIDGTVDLRSFWEENSLSILNRMVSLQSKERINFKMAPIIDETVAGALVFNNEYKKLNPVEDVAQNGHKDLKIDEIRDICTKN